VALLQFATSGRRVRHLGAIMSAVAEVRDAVLCDLDGVVWLSHEPISGSVAAITDLRNRGHRVLFVTNNSALRLADQEAALARIGIDATGDVVTSAQAAAGLVAVGSSAMVCGGEGIREALEARGVDVRDEGPVDAVLVGFHRHFDYEGMRRASAAVRTGARLLGTNDDATYPTPEGLIPGGGAILAAVATAAGVTPIVAGKPYAPMAELVRSTLGAPADGPLGAVMVGDRPDTDGRFAVTLQCRYAQVWSGVTSEGDDLGLTPDLIGQNLADIAAQLTR
jgi:HAD superfamily hydrolase (TIGR01450 family)